MCHNIGYQKQLYFSCRQDLLCTRCRWVGAWCNKALSADRLRGGEGVLEQDCGWKEYKIFVCPDFRRGKTLHAPLS